MGNSWTAGGQWVGKGCGRAAPRAARLGVVLAVTMITGVCGPAAAEASGNETIDAVFLVSGLTGHREVVASAVVARGVYNGVGRIVEIESEPGDPDNLNRDDLVFPDGTLHLLSAGESFSLALNPISCTYSFQIKEPRRWRAGRGGSGTRPERRRQRYQAMVWPTGAPMGRATPTAYPSGRQTEHESTGHSGFDHTDREASRRGSGPKSGLTDAAHA